MNAHASRELSLGLCLLGLALGQAACAPRLAMLELPSGEGRPLESPAVRAAADAVAAPCRDLQALTADLRISGRVDGEKVRGTLQVGVAADSVRIEGVPPFGAPVFILAGRTDAATLLFGREGVYVKDTPVASLTEAIVGVALAPGDLLSLLGGCGVASADPVGAVTIGDSWVRLDLADGVRAWLTSSGTGGPLTLRVAQTRDWRVDYERQEPGRSLRGTLRRIGSDATQLTFEVAAPDRVAALPEGATAVTIPADARPIPLDRLRRQRALAES